LSTLVRMRNDVGPVMVTRYNLYVSAPVNGVIIPPLSTGQGIDKIDELAKNTLPASMATEWTDLTYMQIKAGNQAMYVFALAVVLVLLGLAGRFKILKFPLGVLWLWRCAGSVSSPECCCAGSPWTFSCRSASWCSSASRVRTPS
jgi:multidrug efflux pump